MLKRWYDDIDNSEPSICSLQHYLSNLIVTRSMDEIDAFFHEHESQLEHLLNYTDENGHTFLHTAADFGNSVIVDRLIEMKLNVNAMSKRGQAPLHQTRDVATANLLLINGANVNRVCQILTITCGLGSYEWEGATALHIATRCYEQQMGFIDLLLKFGADIHSRDGEGNTPRDYLRKESLKIEFDGLVKKHQGMVAESSPFIVKEDLKSIVHTMEVNLSNHQPGRVIANKEYSVQEQGDICASLWFRCLGGIAMIAGGIMLAIGISLLAPLFIGIGAGVMLATAASIGLAEYGLFSNKNKPPKCSEALDDDFGVGLAT